MTTFYNPAEGLAVYTAAALPTTPTYVSPYIVSTDVPVGETIKIHGAITIDVGGIPTYLTDRYIHIDIRKSDGTLLKAIYALSAPPGERYVEVSTEGLDIQTLDVLWWYEGDETYQACELTGTININGPVVSTSITVLAPPDLTFNKSYGDHWFEPVFSLRGPDGFPVGSGRPVKLMMTENGSAWYEIASGYTGSDGSVPFSVNWYQEFGGEIGDVYEAKAIFDGDSDYSSSESAVITFTVIEVEEYLDTLLSTELSSPNINVGETQTVSGTLQTIYGIILQGKDIDIYQRPDGGDYVYLTTVPTGSGGEYSFSFVVQASGKWTIKTVFEGTAPVAGVGYRPSQGLAGFSVAGEGEEDNTALLVIGGVVAIAVIGSLIASTG